MEMEAEWLRRNEGGEQCGKYTRGRMAAEAKRDKGVLAARDSGSKQTSY